MSRRRIRAVALLVAAFAVGAPAQAQWGYPGGYGGYGMSRWGADPGAGYMAGLGSFARGQGVYQLEKAKADAINVETVQKWNKALRARQLQLRQDKAKADAQLEAERQERTARRDLEDGTTLNELLLGILDADPGAAHAAQVATPLSPSAIREIPFEWDSEAISLCLDQMTGEESLPGVLASSQYQAERDALKTAVSKAFAEDVKGPVSEETLQSVHKAVAEFRAAFQKHAEEYQPGYQDAREYLTTLDSLTRLLHDPSLQTFLKELDEGKERTVGDLLAFMNAFNLRFGPATSPHQVELYGRLVPMLGAVHDAAVAARPAQPSAADPHGVALQEAAKAAFKGITWDELDAHAHDRGK